MLPVAQSDGSCTGEKAWQRSAEEARGLGKM